MRSAAPRHGMAGSAATMELSLESTEVTSTDKAVHELVSSGDIDSAVSILMNEHGSAVFTRAYRIVGDRPSAKDVLQETFLQVYLAISSFRRQSSFKTWLLAIATYRAVDVVRRRRQDARRDAAGADLAMLDGPDIDQAGIVDATRSTRALEACLRKLCPEVRAAVLMRFQQGTTYEEMAVLFGDKPATLHARVSRAMSVLRRCLRSKGIMP
jgi:RNA polymerase sigma-70 factor, ECF subfamily